MVDQKIIHGILQDLVEDLVSEIRSNVVFDASDALRYLPRASRDLQPDSYWVRAIGRFLTGTHKVDKKWLCKKGKKANRQQYYFTTQRPTKDLIPDKEYQAPVYAVDERLKMAVAAVVWMDYEIGEYFTYRDLVHHIMKGAVKPIDADGLPRRLGNLFRIPGVRRLLGIGLASRRDGFKRYVKETEPLDVLAKAGRELLGR